MESRPKLFLAARVPQYLEITYPGFTSCGRTFTPHKMYVQATPTKGAKLYVEFNEENLNDTAHACPHTHPRSPFPDASSASVPASGLCSLNGPMIASLSGGWGWGRGRGKDEEGQRFRQRAMLARGSLDRMGVDFVIGASTACVGISCFGYRSARGFLS